MKTSIKSIHSVKVTVLLGTLCACLVVLALSLATIPSGAVDADAAAKQAMADWKAAVAAVGEAKKTAKAAQEKKGIALANFKSGGITAAEQKILDQLLAEEAAANAALEAAMERLFAAREALENALQALADDSDLKKELKRQRDSLILDDPNARGESRKVKNPQTQQIAQTQTSGGLHVTTFNTEHGRVTVNLPDDMRAGDTISGTVFNEPKGSTAEERAKNQSVLEGLVLEIDGKRVSPFSANPEKEREAAIQQSIWIYTTVLKTNEGAAESPRPISSGRTMATSEPTGGAGYGMTVVYKAPSGQELGRATIPIYSFVQFPPTHPSGAIITPDPKITQPTHPSGAIITPDPKITPTHPDAKVTSPVEQPGKILTIPGTFASGPDDVDMIPYNIPPLGQTGRSIEITGPFDGNSSNTKISFQPIVREATSPPPITGMSSDFDVVAESPRKAVVTAPTNVTGPMEIRVKEGTTEVTAPFRNLGVNLSAPKTSLLKGEKTELRVEVTGLQGIKEPVPLTLECNGVISMEGGTYQPLVIQPSQVSADGRYSTTRGITGVQAGGWGATATVETRRFNVCLQDDSTREFVLVWNTFTGDYIFNCPGCLPPKGGGGTVAPSGTAGLIFPSLYSVIGTGTMTRKGCVVTLEHKTTDRKVMSTIDQCTHTGSASVQAVTPKVKFTIMDRTLLTTTPAHLSRTCRS